MNWYVLVCTGPQAENHYVNFLIMVCMYICIGMYLYAQAYKLKIEEEMLTRTRWELENLETERKEMEERRKKMEFG